MAEVVLGRGGPGRARTARREARREERAEALKARPLEAARRGAPVEAGLAPPELVDERALALALVRVELGVAREVRQEPRGRRPPPARGLGRGARVGRARDAAEAVQVVEARLLGQRGLLVRVAVALEPPHVGLRGRGRRVVRAALEAERLGHGPELPPRPAQGRDARREGALARPQRLGRVARAGRRPLELRSLAHVRALHAGAQVLQLGPLAPVPAHAPRARLPLEKKFQVARAAPEHALCAVRDDELPSVVPQAPLCVLVLARHEPQPLPEGPRVPGPVGPVRGGPVRARQGRAAPRQLRLQVVDFGRARPELLPHDLRRGPEAPQRRVVPGLARGAAPLPQLEDPGLPGRDRSPQSLQVLARRGVRIPRRVALHRPPQPLRVALHHRQQVLRAPCPRHAVLERLEAPLAPPQPDLRAPRRLALPRARLPEPLVLVLREPQPPRSCEQPVKVGHLAAPLLQALDLARELGPLRPELLGLGLERVAVARLGRGPREDHGPVALLEVALQRPVPLEGLAQRGLVGELGRHVDGREEARDVGPRPVPLQALQEPVQRGVDLGLTSLLGAPDPALARARVLRVPQGRVLEELEAAGQVRGALV